uniref:Uncharacterized protein n=1 Tax=Tetranychus urticae TaxID=32264 RepID=T1KTE9_TETUR
MVMSLDHEVPGAYCSEFPSNICYFWYFLTSLIPKSHDQAFQDCL